MAAIKELEKGWWFNDTHKSNIQVAEVTDEYLTLQSSGPIYGSWIEWLSNKGWVLHSSPSKCREIYDGWTNAKITVFKRVPQIVELPPSLPIYRGEKFEVYKGTVDIVDVDGEFITIKTRFVPSADVYRYMQSLRNGYRVIAGPTRTTHAGLDTYYTTFQEI